MNLKNLAIILVAIVVSAMILSYSFSIGAFSTSGSSIFSNQTATPELRVFVATSLASIVENMSRVFEEAYHCDLIINSAGSNTLYQQISLGSPCDVFMSADFNWNRKLNEIGLLYNSTYQNFTTNTLIVMLPKNNPANITTLLDLAVSGVKIVLADPSVPSGAYANKTILQVESKWGNCSSNKYRGAEWENYYGKVMANVVSFEPTVEDVVSKVVLNLGTVDAGIGFVSDATLQGDKLHYIEIPLEVNTRGTYGISIINTTNQKEIAAAFMDYWLSTEGQALLEAFGFGT